MMTVARDSALLLTKMEDFYNMRDRKKELTLDLKNMLQELEELVRRLEPLMADPDLRAEIEDEYAFSLKEKQHEEERKKISSTLHTKDVKTKKITDVDRLQYTLDKLEKKLEELNSQ